MQKLKTLIGTALLSIITTNASAVNFNPHIGIDYKHWAVEARQTDPDKDFVQIFPNLSRSGAFYIGTRINKVWGIDVGHERSSQKDKWHSFDYVQTVFGEPSALNDATQVTIRLSSWYVSALYYLELCKNLEFVFHAGISSLQPKSDIIYHPVGNPLIDLRFKTESKYAGRFGLGLQYLFFKNFGARALITFDQTSRIDYVGMNHLTNPFVIHPYKNAASYNVGLFAEFP